ncbi:potassium channel family protein [Halalkalibacter urbisdiaboli]|uniref:potassium channel family protein n=1 Tax=Halalkalibacter urbisdiaboli TaxID=1960589 RepID=UPI000B42D6A7|nr:potassium channel family protein [Halalkalibacter urbisdiaboli]
MLVGLIKKVLKKSINIEHWKLIIFGIVFIILSGFIMYWLEPKEFKTPFNGFWFVMTTVSQVGFGDFIPKTVVGKLYTVILYLCGVGLFAIMIAKWIDLLNNYEEMREAEIMGYQGEHHLVMINWSQKTKKTIEGILRQNPSANIVLIDQMSNSPMNHKQIHYVQGNPSKSATLERANILKADSICIFAIDYPADQTSEDGKTLLIASTIKHLANQHETTAKVIAEILDEDHISNTNQEFVDEFILSTKPFTDLMASTALRTQP